MKKDKKFPVMLDGEAVDEAELCPECGAPLRLYHSANGPDDYNREAECPECGAYFTE